jgi:hypothetical protein
LSRLYRDLSFLQGGISLCQAYRAIIYDDTGLEIRKKIVMTRIFPVRGEKPALSMAAIKIENTEVVAHVEEAWSLVYTSGKIKTPRLPIILKTIPISKKTCAIQIIVVPPFVQGIV